MQKLEDSILIPWLAENLFPLVDFTTKNLITRRDSRELRHWRDAIVSAAEGYSLSVVVPANKTSLGRPVMLDILSIKSLIRGL